MTNHLQESILKDPELGQHYWDELVAKAQRNPIFNKAIKEGLYSDVAGALGAIQDTVWAAARAATIGRELLKVMPTKNALERFPCEVIAYAFDGEGPPKKTAAKALMTDIKANVEFSTGKEWTESFVEDASWNVLAWQTEAIGYALAKRETEKVVALYNAIAAADLANGSESTIASPITWQNITDNLGYVEGQDFHPNVVAVSPTVYSELLRLDQFIHGLYLDPQNIKKGVIQHTTLDVTFIRSSLMTKTLFIDTNTVGVLLIRRDSSIKPYEDTSRNVYGVVGSQRIGLGILRSKAVQRGSR